MPTRIHLLRLENHNIHLYSSCAANTSLISARDDENNALQVVEQVSAAQAQTRLAGASSQGNTRTNLEQLALALQREPDHAGTRSFCPDDFHVASRSAQLGVSGTRRDTEMQSTLSGFVPVGLLKCNDTDQRFSFVFPVLI
jgi:hypothetical protein